MHSHLNTQQFRALIFQSGHLSEKNVRYFIEPATAEDYILLRKKTTGKTRYYRIYRSKSQPETGTNAVAD